MVSLRAKIFIVALAVLLLSQRWWLPLLGVLINLVALPSRWHDRSAQSYISEEHDNFDITFASYSVNQSILGLSYQDVVPPILHHINLGPKQPSPEWMAARDECIEYHPDWKAYIWDDKASNEFVKEKFPHLKEMWDNYHFPVERVDALRYMVLQKYGGVVLDFDLACKRNLDPLRRFEFVAPSAHPTGFSIGFMMSSPGNPFVHELVDNLSRYNHAWFFLPYVTVMFSTGCHYASTIFTLHKNRSALRILGGIPGHPRLHMLNGYVDTPLFRHLGSSSWHSFDAFLINWLGHRQKGLIIVIFIVLSFLVGSLVTTCLTLRQRRRYAALRSRLSSIDYESHDGSLLIKEA
ncbi:putative glycosyl transferase [Talaromyces proteolyticus]|uniref:Glycosyl transferase n=1 Tax=Talaromyces proteolyticus TaxID=1131652 RepID=A0AAD4L1D9_9EURO|nr:putative glycosyl transferase [Talaromyces proteolyticus]KAH8705782.1 putative glycosyl transferase [Talaromyces proteolyticus]